jgi:ssDNA-binding replication factor A large subunit
MKHANECIDALAIIDGVDEPSSVVAKATQKTLIRRNVTLVDDGCVQVQLTLWSDDVDKITPDMIGNVIGIKGAPVREFNGNFTNSSKFNDRF